MEKLHYTPQSIKELEDEVKKPYTDILGSFSVTSIIYWLRFGLKIEEPEAMRIIEEHLKESDLLSMYILIMKKLQATGFLPRKINLDKMEQDMEKGIEGASKGEQKPDQNTSAVIGSQESPTQ